MTQCVPNTDRTQAGLESQPSSQEKSPVGCDYLEGCLEAVAQPASVTQGLWLGRQRPSHSFPAGPLASDPKVVRGGPGVPAP